MKRILILLFILSAAMECRAQNGFAGKRLLLKLDGYNTYVNRFPNIGAELILNRHFTFSAELNAGRQQTRQMYILQLDEKVYYSDFTRDYIKSKMDEKATVSHVSVALSLRKYLGNRKLVAAPYGAFFSMGFRKGRINKIEGTFNESVLFSSTAYTDSPKSYEAENIPYYSIQAGFGRHSFISSRLSLDFLIGLNYNKFSTMLGRDGNFIVSGVTNNFGPNVIRLYTNKRNKAVTSYNFGIFLNFSVGYLLF